MGTLKPQSSESLYSDTVAADGWAFLFGTERRGLGGAAYHEEGPGRDAAPTQSAPRCTKRNSSPVNGQCTNFMLFNVAL